MCKDNHVNILIEQIQVAGAKMEVYIDEKDRYERKVAELSEDLDRLIEDLIKAKGGETNNE